MPGVLRYWLSGLGKAEVWIDFQKDKFGQMDLVSSGLDKEFYLKMVTDLGFHAGKAGQILHEANVTKRETAVCSFRDGRQATIFACSQKGTNPFNGYRFWSMDADGRKIDIYRVGFGRKAIYLCIYVDGVLSAMYAMDMQEKNFESGYTVYAEPWVPEEWLAVIGVFMDITVNAPDSSVSVSHALNTPQKALKAKFDPNFIPRIQAKIT